MRWAKPLDTELLLQVAAAHEALVTRGRGLRHGRRRQRGGRGFAGRRRARPLLQLGLPDHFIEHGDPVKLLAMQGLDAAGIEASVVQRFGALLGPTRPALKIVA